MWDQNWIENFLGPKPETLWDQIYFFHIIKEYRKVKCFIKQCDRPIEFGPAGLLLGPSFPTLQIQIGPNPCTKSASCFLKFGAETCHPSLQQLLVSARSGVLSTRRRFTNSLSMRFSSVGRRSRRNSLYVGRCLSTSPLLPLTSTLL